MNGEKLAPPRTVGFWGTSLFPLNGMIGAGIFALPAVLVAAVGNFAPWMMLLGGIMFMPMALVYAWLAGRFDHSGGPVLYGEAAFGRFVGFQAGWSRYASAIVTGAANTHVMIAYLAVVFPALDDPTTASIAVAFVLAATTIINLLGMRGAIGTLGAMTFIKVVPLIILVLSALFAGNPATGFALPQFSEVETVVLLLFYAFMGFESVTEAAGEFRDPRRDVPRAIVSMVLAMTVLYVAIIWAYLAIGPGTGNEKNALAGTARVALGDFGSIMIVVAAAFSIGANTFAGATTLPRLSFGMAERGMLPAWFMGLSKRWLTPANSIVFGGVASVALGLWEGFEVLAMAGTLVRLVTYVICAAALPVLERREGMNSPFHLACAAFAVISSLWVATHADANAYLVLAGILVGGTVLYFLAARETPVTPTLAES